MFSVELTILNTAIDHKEEYGFDTPHFWSLSLQ